MIIENSLTKINNYHCFTTDTKQSVLIWFLVLILDTILAKEHFVHKIKEV